MIVFAEDVENRSQAAFVEICCIVGCLGVLALGEESLKGEVASFLNEDLEVLVDDSNSKENTSAGADCTEEVCCDSEGTNAHTTECGSCGDDSVEDLNHSVFSVTSDNHVLILKLSSDILGR